MIGLNYRLKAIARKLAQLSNTVLTENGTVEENIGLYAKWSSSRYTENNLGDSLNPVVVNFITGKDAINVDQIWFRGRNPVYFFMGSTLDNLCHKNAVVCGAGFKSSLSKIYAKPEVVAVRGPKTREVLVRHGISCPEVYCDPGLFVSDIFPKTSIEATGLRVGIIAHYADKQKLAELTINSNGIEYVILDIESKAEMFFRDLVSCNFIASSSLHGLIFSISYGIPCVRLVLSNELLGGDFKFQDFFESLGVNNHCVISTRSEINIENIINSSKSISCADNKASYLKAMEMV